MLAVLVSVAAGAQPLTAPLLAIDFDRLAQRVLPDGVAIRTQFAAPDVVPGVSGSAWRSDGFSSHLEAPLTLDPQAGFTLSLWVALDSYPSDLELPVSGLAPSSVAQQAAGDAGFDLHIDTYGRWGLRVATSAGVLNVAAPGRFPLQRWVHLAASVNPAGGSVALYRDGIQVGSASGRPGMRLLLAPVPLRLATPAVEAHILQFTVNRLNAAYDEVAVHGQALESAQLTLLAARQPPEAVASLQVPDSRFAADPLRPRVHPLPPANWANEPHGLLRVGQDWHLFYQRTPNGPFKTQMHWGHMTSRDLLRWQHRPDALRPELQTDTFGFDMKGIWSGGVVADGGRVWAFYTSVNHGDRIGAANPGIALAVSDDLQLRSWRKLGPVLDSRGVRDFRDPFVWREAGRWHMLIGAALESGGGLDYHVLQGDIGSARWQRQPRFVDPGYADLDPGSAIWEMPVFERLSDSVSVLVVNPIGGRIGKYGDPATRALYWTGTWSDGVFKPFFRVPKALDLVPGHLAPTVGRGTDGRLRAIGIVDERRSPRAQQRAGWANVFSLPRVWSLLPDGRTLGQAPAPELAALRGAARAARDAVAIGNEPLLLAADLRAYELLIEIDAAGAEPIAIDLLASGDGREATRLLFDPAANRVGVDLRRSSLAPDGEGPRQLDAAYDSDAFGPMRTLRVIVDGSVIEVFVNDAAAYAVRSYPSLAGSEQLRLSTPGKRPVVAGLRLWPLRLPT